MPGGWSGSVLAGICFESRKVSYFLILMKILPGIDVASLVPDNLNGDTCAE
jgi:hypothetical protein